MNEWNILGELSTAFVLMDAVGIVYFACCLSLI